MFHIAVEEHLVGVSREYKISGQREKWKGFNLSDSINLQSLCHAKQRQLEQRHLHELH